LDNSAPRTSAAISEAPGRTQSDARAYSRHASRRPLLMTSWCELAADTASPAPGDARPDAMPLDQRSGGRSRSRPYPRLHHRREGPDARGRAGPGDPMNLNQGLTDLVAVGLVAVLAPIVVALLPGPRIPQVVIFLVGGVLIGPHVLGVAETSAIQLLADVGLG